MVSTICMEIWKKIDGFENYSVSNFGNVRNDITKYIKKKTLLKNGYYKVGLNHNTTIYLHILIAKAFISNPDNLPRIDHIDRNKLNNSLDNLRWVNNSTNLHNMSIPKHNTSGFKGVSFDKSRNKYIAQINVDGKHIHIGRFDTKEEAYEARVKYCKDNNIIS